MGFVNGRPNMKGTKFYLNAKKDIEWARRIGSSSFSMPRVMRL